MTPRITLLVLAYRQAEYIEAAVASALAQMGEPIEIILSDDASPDDSFDRMQSLAARYQGPHLVRLNRNPTNLGIGGHYNRLIDLARGQLIVTQAGDDISLPHRVTRVLQVWNDHEQKPDLIASHLTDIQLDGTPGATLPVDDLSKWPDVQSWLRRRPYVVGAAHAFTKRMHQRFGPFVEGLTYEDQTNALRAIGLGGAVTVPEALVQYRRGGVSGGLQSGSAEEFLAWIRNRNQAHLALHAQWIQDALTLGCAAEIGRATLAEHDRERCLLQMLSATSRSQLWKVALTPCSPPLNWRIRKALHLSLPHLAAGRYRLNR